MLLSNARLFGMTVAGFVCVAAQGQAQDNNVTTGANSAKFGGEFRGEWIYDDHGLEKTKGNDPSATSDIAVKAANIKLGGKINPNTEYMFKFSLLGTGLSEGYGRHWLNNMIGFSIGRQKVLQGGFDYVESNYTKHVVGAYASNLVFSEFSDMIALHVKAGGDLTLQIVDDVVGDWNTKEKQTWILGWTGAFGPISPMVNIGSYDNNKSMYFDVGVKTAMNGLTASLDIHMNQGTAKEPDVDPKKNKELKDTATAYTLNLAYEVKGTMTPWAYFSVYDRKEATDSKIARRAKETKTNTAATYDAAGNMTSPAQWDDNGTTWGVGANFHMMGQGWSPFVAIIGQSGKWEDPADATKEETKSNMMIKIGALGEI